MLLIVWCQTHIAPGLASILNATTPLFSVALGIYAADISGNQALSHMALDHPELRYKIQLSDWRVVADQVLSRSVDIGLAKISVAEGNDNLRTRLVGQHDVILYCRRDHPLAGQKGLTNQELN